MLNDAGDVLMVQELHGPLRGSGTWKMPTGLVNHGEDLHIAAPREVLEETVRGTLHCIITLSTHWHVVPYSDTVVSLFRCFFVWHSMMVTSARRCTLLLLLSPIIDPSVPSYGKFQGIRAKFEAVLTVRESHGMAFGKSDLFFVCALR